MSATEKIEMAAEALVQTIRENGYRIADVAVDDIRPDQVELFRYPPEEYHTAVCAVPDEAATHEPQARPPTYTTAPREGEPTARLSMEDWDPPHTWEGPVKAPDNWPHATVDALVQLFTNRSPAATAHGPVPLPAPLARHIALLIEDWCANDFDHDLPALRRDAPFNDSMNSDPSNAIEYSKACLQRTAL